MALLLFSIPYANVNPLGTTITSILLENKFTSYLKWRLQWQ